MIDPKTHIAVGELCQAAAHAHGLTGPVPFRVLSERAASVSSPTVREGVPAASVSSPTVKEGIASEPGAIATGFLSEPPASAGGQTVFDPEYLHDTEAFDA